MVEEIFRSVDLPEEEEKVNPTFSSYVQSQSVLNKPFASWYRAFDYIVSSDNMHGVLGKQFIGNGERKKIMTALKTFCLYLNLAIFWACGYSLNFKGSLQCSVKFTPLLRWRFKPLLQEA